MRVSDDLLGRQTGVDAEFYRGTDLGSEGCFVDAVNILKEGDMRQKDMKRLRSDIYRTYAPLPRC